MVGQARHDFLGVYIEKAGVVLADPAVGTAVRRRSPYLLEFPYCAASSSLKRLARDFYADMDHDGATREHGFFKKLAKLIRGA